MQQQVLPLNRLGHHFAPLLASVTSPAVRLTLSYVCLVFVSLWGRDLGSTILWHSQYTYLGLQDNYQAASNVVQSMLDTVNVGFIA